MASAPNANLPLFYKSLVPLNSNQHGTWRAKSTDKAAWLAKEHAVPITVEEFPLAQRDFPIVFSSGENPVPLALMGLNEGVNTFFDEEGNMTSDCYVPAYARRYPFLLAKLQPDADQLSLCFDNSSGLVGEFEDGEALFTDGQPSEATQNILKFNENFEQAGQRTKAFMDELAKAGLLMDGEVSIGRDGEAPFIYRGFQMVNQEKLKEVRGDQLRSWNQSGLLPLVFAHLFSLNLMRDIFSKQAAMGKAPKPQVQQA
ncbi:multidrug transporter [Croceicoccus ponticola]|uniref:Multidrug transporter n=1 Tax=Croceicoccus ponticola TaxID=2217664 RepID=A0A437GZW4_9SPHN|nr:SapC family protein [Croceicoccus ponticola]RVQ68917.1 multidrug transporter [Croceicoccus ponticola]